MTEEKIKQLSQELKNNFPNIKLFFNRPLAEYTSLKLGGPSRLLIIPQTTQELILSWQLSQHYQLPTLILGSGTNVLISEKGFPGVTIINRVEEFRILKKMPKQLEFEITSGASLAGTIRKTLDLGFKDLLPFITIPGTIGGAIWNNAHYKNQLIGSFIVSVTTLDKQGNLKRYAHREINFAYDYSIFQEKEEFILSGRFKLNQPLRKDDDYQQKIKNYFQERQKNQPSKVYSTGCIFKNLDPQIAKKLHLPSYHSGYLIDKAGLKGLKIGEAEVSQKHANFIIHRGQATSQDFYQLIRLVQKKIKEKYGCPLELEVKLIGF